MSVLVVTHSEDNVCIPAVMEAIRRRGGQPIRFDTDLFPTKVRIAVRYDGPTEELRLTTPEGTFDLAEVTAVWHRRIAFGRWVPQDLEREVRRACVQESRATAMGLLASLRAFHLDLEVNVRSAEHKQLQLRVARELGFETPRTLMTNDPEALRAFAATCPGGLLTKMVSSFAVHRDGKEMVVFTTPMKPADLENTEGLDLSPMSFQERVPKALELRVTIVGDRVFPAAVDSGAIAGAGDDWRRRGPALTESWKPHTLPRELEQRIMRFMDFFGLNYGAMDFILTPDGRLVFLEINPVGEFFWLDDVFAPPISDAMADVLLGRVWRRAGPSPAALDLRVGQG